MEACIPPKLDLNAVKLIVLNVKRHRLLISILNFIVKTRGIKCLNILCSTSYIKLVDIITQETNVRVSNQCREALLVLGLLSQGSLIQHALERYGIVILYPKLIKASELPRHEPWIELDVVELDRQLILLRTKGYLYKTFIVKRFDNELCVDNSLQEVVNAVCEAYREYGPISVKDATLIVSSLLGLSKIEARRIIELITRFSLGGIKRLGDHIMCVENV